MMVYLVKFRVIVWRAARCVRPCDRLLSPLPVILLHLRIRKNDTDNSCYYGLPAEVKTDRVESCKASEAL